MRFKSCFGTIFLASILSQAVATEPSPSSPPVTPSPSEQSSPGNAPAAAQSQPAPAPAETPASPVAAANPSSTANPGGTTVVSQPNTEAKTADPSAKALKAPLSRQERALVAAGYKVRIRDGERQFCKTDTALGSRLNTKTICGTADTLTQAEGDRQDQVRRIQQGNGRCITCPP
jgi:hypothetical protein